MKVALVAARSAVSMKITDSPGAMLVTPLSVTAVANASELSSTFQPVMLTGVEPELVTSNQSAPTGLLPLDHGATSEMTSDAPAGISIATSVTVRRNDVDASGEVPPSYRRR